MIFFFKMSSHEIQNGEPQVVTNSNGLNAQFVEIPIEGETIGFESIVGKQSSKSGLKTYDFVRDIPKKVKQTLHRSVTRLHFATIYT